MQNWSKIRRILDQKSYDQPTGSESMKEPVEIGVSRPRFWPENFQTHLLRGKGPKSGSSDPDFGPIFNLKMIKIDQKVKKSQKSSLPREIGLLKNLVSSNSPILAP